MFFLLYPVVMSFKMCLFVFDQSGSKFFKLCTCKLKLVLNAQYLKKKINKNIYNFWKIQQNFSIEISIYCLLTVIWSRRSTCYHHFWNVILQFRHTRCIFIKIQIPRFFLIIFMNLDMYFGWYVLLRMVIAWNTLIFWMSLLK